MYASRVILAVAVVLLSGCWRAKLLEKQTDAVIEFNKTQAQQFDSRIGTLADTTGCTDDTCRVAAKAIAGMATVSQKPSYMPMPVAPPSLLDRAVDGLVNRVLPVAVSEYGRAYSSKKAAEVQIAQWQAFGNAVDAALSGEEGPSYVITDSYNTDSSDHSEHGDTIVDSGNTTITDSQNGDHAGRDIIGRDRIDNSGNYGNDNRQTSPGPIDNSDDGDDCSGESCNPVTPLPTPTPEG